MTDDQRALFDALKELNSDTDSKWAAVVAATNKLVKPIESGKEKYNPYMFPIELAREIDQSALRTCWIYSRLEQHSRGDTRKRIRKALGYTYP